MYMSLLLFWAALSLVQPGPSPAALERQIVRCGQMNNFRDALFLLDQLRAIGPPSAKAINSVAAACARSGQYDRTFSLLKELSERGAWDSFSYTTAITAHGKRRQWAKALALLRTIKEPNEFVFGAAIGACAAAGRWAEAIALLDDMEARGIPSNARCYNGALSACDRADQPEVALRLFEKMRTGEEERIRPTTISYTSAISACARRPSYAERSPALLAQMRRDGLRPNAVTFGATAQAYATLGHWEAALQLLADMEAEGVAPNIVVLSNIVNACAEAAEWKPALALTHGMSSRYGVTPDVACINAAIKACARAQEPAAALELLDGLGKRANVRSFGTALAALASCVPPRWEDALSLLSRMRSVGLAPSLECHTAVLAACGTAREMREVIAIWQGLLDDPEMRRQVDGLCAATVLDACLVSEEWRVGLRIVGQLHEELGAPATAPATAATAAMAPAALASEIASEIASDWTTPGTTPWAVLAEEAEAEAARTATATTPTTTTTTTTTRARAAPKPATLTARQLNDQLSRVCMQLDALRRHGTLKPDEPPSFEAALGVCERWGLGGKLLLLLDRMAEDEARQLEALRAPMAVNLDPRKWAMRDAVAADNPSENKGGGADYDTDGR